MSRNPEWEQVDPEIVRGLRKYYPYYSKGCPVQNFPKKCVAPDLMQLRGQQTNYSCSLEMAQLSLDLSHLPKMSDKEVARAIKLTPEGSDPMNLYRGLEKLGVKCQVHRGVKAYELKERLRQRDSVYIWNGQQPDGSTKKELLETVSGHYMAACCGDEKYAYFADPGYVTGKTRIQWQYLDYLWHDIELATGKVIYGFMIEVAIAAELL